MLAVVFLEGEAELAEVVLAMGAAGGFAGGLDGWGQQGDQGADDGDHGQQLDERKSASARRSAARGARKTHDLPPSNCASNSYFATGPSLAGASSIVMRW
jgi:hypothetical protein